MKIKKIKTDSIHDLAVRLCEGGIVEFKGHCIKAEEVEDDLWVCYNCEMDCICRSEMVELCAECDALTHTKHILKLAL